MSEEKLMTLSPETLHALIQKKLEKAGLPEVQAIETAKHLVDADMRGVHSHGAMRVEYYAERINKGGITLEPATRLEKTGECSGVFHGDNAQGQYVASLAAATAIDMAKKNGVAIIGVSKSGHIGTLSYYLRKIAKAGLIGITMAQSDPMAVPYGGSEPYYGTNPLGFGAPSTTETPLIFDMATTAQTWGKVLSARLDGSELPTDCAVDENGQTTTDPHRVHGLLPIAGPKGYGLMMMVDVLTGVLMNLPFGKHVSSMYDDLHAGRNLGQLYIVLDPARFGDPDSFKQHITQTMEELTASKPAKDFASVQYPGQGSEQRYQKSQREGIQIPETIVTYLQSEVIHNNQFGGLDSFANK
ncbi:ureidoglycolate dehydrogenase [Enterococcus olivae]